MEQLQHEKEENALPFASYPGGQTVENTAVNGTTLRVTPEEVALAAAALEAKRDAEHAWRETTLPLDEAVHSLGLNATPQEIAPEVEALRTERATRALQEQTRQRTRRAAKIGGFLGLIVLLTLVGGLWLSLSQSQRALHKALHPMTTLPIQKLALVPDHVPVHIDADTLKKLATGEVSPENVSVDTRNEGSEETQATTMFNNEWTLVKSGGTLLVRGWATAEFALNISNGTTGGLFSSRPGWLPANNLVPVEVPVYRLENQAFARYLPDGKIADTGANSVSMAANVADEVTAAKDLMRADLLDAGENFSVNYGDNTSYFEIRIKGDIVHLTGNATTPRLKKLASEIATRTLQRLHVPYTVSNELIVGANQ